jgi:hypothetical protein
LLFLTEIALTGRIFLTELYWEPAHGLTNHGLAVHAIHGLKREEEEEEGQNKGRKEGRKEGGR